MILLVNTVMILLNRCLSLTVFLLECSTALLVIQVTYLFVCPLPLKSRFLLQPWISEGVPIWLGNIKPTDGPFLICSCPSALSHLTQLQIIENTHILLQGVCDVYLTSLSLSFLSLSSLSLPEISQAPACSSLTSEYIYQSLQMDSLDSFLVNSIKSKIPSLLF